MKTIRMAPYLALVVLCAGSVCAQTPTSVEGSVVRENKVVMTVNGDPVRMSDISAAAQGIAQAAARNGMQLSQEQIVEMASSQVVDALLLAQMAKKEGLEVDGTEVATTLQDIVKRAGGREALDKTLAKTGMNFDLLKEGLQMTMLARTYVDEKIRPGVSVSDEEAKAFYDENPQYFERPEQVRASHILINVAEDADEAAVAEARKRAEAALEKAAAGEDFAALATELSEGPSADNGGELGWFSKGQMVEAFTEAAFATEPGKVAEEIVKTQFGFHVIKVHEHREATTMPFDEVVQNIKLNLTERKVSEAADAALKPIREAAEIVPTAPPQGEAKPAEETEQE